jgi:hypothetical protein
MLGGQYQMLRLLDAMPLFSSRPWWASLQWRGFRRCSGGVQVPLRPDVACWKSCNGGPG